MTLNIGEYPNEESASTLSEVLEAIVPRKYYLSTTACEGILRRAENRGKKLDDILEGALKAIVEGRALQCKFAETEDETEIGASVVCSAGFHGWNSITAAGVELREESAPTLTAGKQADVAIKIAKPPIGVDTYNQALTGDKAKTLLAGHQDKDGLPCTVYALQGSMIGREDKNGPQGDGVNKDVCFTLNTIDRHAVVYFFEAYQHHGYRKNAISGTMTAGQNGTIRGDTPIIVERRKKVFDDITTDGDGHKWTQICAECVKKLNIPERLLDDAGSGICGVCGCDNEADYYLDFEDDERPDRNEHCAVIYSDTVGCLCARDYKGVGNQYVQESKLVLEFANVEEFFEWFVRRLTPKECERLQGYPDFWTVLCKIENMTDEEYEFFKDAYLLDKRINGKTIKNIPTRKQLVRWYNKLDCDGTRYRQLGNSLAIPCALRVIGYIADYIREQKERPGRE